MAQILTRRVLAAGLALLGLAVIAGWLARVPALVQLAPGFAAMTISTALCFLLVGAALLAPELAPTRAVRTQALLGWIVFVQAKAMSITASEPTA